MNTYKSMVLHDFSDGVRTHCETGRTDCKYRNTLDMIKSQLNVVFANEVLKSQMTELSWFCVHPCSMKGVLSTNNTVLSIRARTNLHEQIVRSIFECTQLHNFMQHFSPMYATNVETKITVLLCACQSISFLAPQQISFSVKHEWARVKCKLHCSYHCHYHWMFT